MDTRILVAALVTVFVAACGGGGGGGSSAAPAAPSASTPPSASAPAGTSATPSASQADLIRGRITGFGSVFLDGKRFDTSDAAFSKDDVSATQSDLSVGMVVEVRGDISNGTASRVDFEEDIKGPVDQIGPNELTVMGQRVVIAADTVVDDSLNLASLNLGDVLEISGLRGANDSLEAAYIEDKTGNTVSAYKVIGQIRDLDATAKSFRIGDLLIDYSTARLDDGVSIAAGVTVEVKDENKAYNPGDFTLIPTKIEPAGLGRVSSVDDAGSSDSSSSNSVGQRIRVEGLVSEVVSGNQFALGDILVNYTSSTTFAFGGASTISVGSKVQVEGSFDTANSISASKIKFSRNSARVEGQVESVDFSSGQILILGLVVDTSDVGRIEDKRDDVEPFEISDIRIGDFLEIRGNSIGSVLRAQELRRDDEDDARLRGPAANIDTTNRSLSILGVQLTTNSSTQYEGLNDEQLTAGAFFAALADGQTLVDAQWRGSVTDPTVAVRELSLED